MNNNNKSNKSHFNVSDFMHIMPLSTHNNGLNTNQNNKEDQELIMGKQEQKLEASKEQNKPTATQEQEQSDHQKLLTSFTDQATLAGLSRQTLSSSDDVEGIIGISTLGPSHHGPRVPRMIMGSSWKLEAKVAQSSRTASQNMQQPLTTEQATLASSHRRDPNPLDDVEGRVGISAQGSSHHGPRALLKVNGKALKSEYKVA